MIEDHPTPSNRIHNAIDGMTSWSIPGIPRFDGTSGQDSKSSQLPWLFSCNVSDFATEASWFNSTKLADLADSLAQIFELEIFDASILCVFAHGFLYLGTLCCGLCLPCHRRARFTQHFGAQFEPFPGRREMFLFWQQLGRSEESTLLCWRLGVRVEQVQTSTFESVFMETWQHPVCGEHLWAGHQVREGCWRKVPLLHQGLGWNCFERIFGREAYASGAQKTASIQRWVRQSPLYGFFHRRADQTMLYWKDVLPGSWIHKQNCGGLLGPWQLNQQRSASNRQLRSVA